MTLLSSISGGGNALDFPGYSSGQRFNNIPIGCGVRTTTGTYVSNTFAQDALYLSPFNVARDLTIDRIGFYEMASGTATGVKIAIYNVNRNLVADLGIATPNGSAGLKEISVSQFLPKGTYFASLKVGGGSLNLAVLIKTFQQGASTLFPERTVWHDFMESAFPTVDDPLSIKSGASHSYATAAPATLPALTLTQTSLPAIVHLRAA